MKIAYKLFNDMSSYLQKCYGEKKLADIGVLSLILVVGNEVQ